MPEPPPVLAIQRAVADHHGYTLADLTGPRRQQKLADARHLAMWLVRELHPRLSLPQIARVFGYRHHTTIMHACRRIAATKPPAAALVWAEYEKARSADAPGLSPPDRVENTYAV